MIATVLYHVHPGATGINIRRSAKLQTIKRKQTTQTLQRYKDSIAASAPAADTRLVGTMEKIMLAESRYATPRLRCFLIVMDKFLLIMIILPTCFFLYISAGRY